MRWFSMVPETPSPGVTDDGSGVACVTCHAPETLFSDPKPVSMGKSLGIRHTPTIFNAARLAVFFCDGRADSLQ